MKRNCQRKSLNAMKDLFKCMWNVADLITVESIFLW